MNRKETILVTGSGGFIGGWIVEMLYLDQSANVRAGIRSWSSAARLARFPVEFILCDVMDKESIAKAMEGVDCIIHCAVGTVETIVQGTANMLEIAHSKKVRRFVHISTTEVYGNVQGKIDETYPCQHTGNLYGDAKVDAEILCWDYAKKGLPITVVRPPIVYGPFSRDWTVGFAQRLQSKNWRVFKGYGDGICNLIYITDLVSGILLAARNERAVGEAFNLGGPDSISWNQYFQRFNTALKLPELKMEEPGNTRLRTALMDPVRSFGKFILKHFKAPLRKLSQTNKPARELLQFADKILKTTPRNAELSLYDRQALYLSDKAQTLLGYQPSLRIDRGLELSVRWLNNVGLAD